MTETMHLGYHAPDLSLPFTRALAALTRAPVTRAIDRVVDRVLERAVRTATAGPCAHCGRDGGHAPWCGWTRNPSGLH